MAEEYKCFMCGAPIKEPDLFPGPDPDNLNNPEFRDFCEFCYMKLFNLEEKL